MDRKDLLKRLEKEWLAFNESYAGLSDAALEEPGVVGDWSVKDLLGHITTWEEEALKALPRIMEGLKPPRYNGIDRFNAEQSHRKRELTLAEVRKQLVDTHQRLLAFLKVVPESYIARETRFRHRLRLDTYSHYKLHATSILTWRQQRGI